MMENTKAALKRQGDPRWLLVLVVMLGLTVLVDMTRNHPADCAEAACKSGETK